MANRRTNPFRSGELAAEQSDGARLPILTPGGLPEATAQAYNDIRDAAMKVIFRQEDQAKRDFLAKEYTHYLNEWAATAKHIVHEQHAISSRRHDPFEAERIARIQGAQFVQKINERLYHAGTGNREAMNLLANELNPSLLERYVNLHYDSDKGRKDGFFEGLKFDGILGTALGGLGALKLFEMGGGTLLAGAGAALFAVGATVFTPKILRWTGLTPSETPKRPTGETAHTQSTARSRFDGLAGQQNKTAAATPDMKDLAAKAGKVTKAPEAEDMGDAPHAETFRAAATPAPEKLTNTKENPLRV